MESSISDIDDKYLKFAVETDGSYSGKISDWKKDDDKNFEAALESFGYTPDKIPQIAKFLNKTVEEVMYYYEALFHDIKLIESGLVKTDYAEYRPSPAPSSDSLVNEKKRGKNWSEEEHRAFLEGLEERGKGDWKNISRDYVKTRTPTQVASHAQKYYKRQAEQTDETDGTKKKKKRSSIHDITSVGISSVNIPPLPAPHSGLDSVSQPCNQTILPHFGLDCVSQPQNHTIPPRFGSDSLSQPENHTIPPPARRSGLDYVSQPCNQTIPPMFGLDYVSQQQNHTIPPRFGSDSLSQPENHTILPRSDWDYVSQPHHQQMHPHPQQCSYFDDLAEFL